MPCLCKEPVIVSIPEIPTTAEDKLEENLLGLELSDKICSSFEAGLLEV